MLLFHVLQTRREKEIHCVKEDMRTTVQVVRATIAKEINGVCSISVRIGQEMKLHGLQGTLQDCSDDRSEHDNSTEYRKSKRGGTSVCRSCRWWTGARTRRRFRRRLGGRRRIPISD